MAADLRLKRSPDREDEWTVALNGRAIVGFYGPDARRMAERQRDELAMLLKAQEVARRPDDWDEPRE